MIHPQSIENHFDEIASIIHEDTIRITLSEVMDSSPAELEVYVMMITEKENDKQRRIEAARRRS